jgi:hypothetical protein
MDLIKENSKIEIGSALRNCDHAEKCRWNSCCPHKYPHPCFSHSVRYCFYVHKNIFCQEINIELSKNDILSEKEIICQKLIDIDIFMLSDSITIVSELLDKNYPGMEYNPEFAKIMEKRLKFTNKEKK